MGNCPQIRFFIFRVNLSGMDLFAKQDPVLCGINSNGSVLVTLHGVLPVAVKIGAIGGFFVFFQPVFIPLVAM